jgi:hypothetical protein
MVDDTDKEFTDVRGIEWVIFEAEGLTNRCIV